MSEDKSKNLKIGQVVFGLLMVVLMTFFFSRNNSNKNSDNVSIDSELVKVADEFNKVAPFMINAETRFDNMITLTGKVMQWNLTAINQTKDEIDVSYFENEMKPIVINQMRTNPQLAKLRKIGVSMRYAYKDKDGIFVTQVEITPEMYK